MSEIRVFLNEVGHNVPTGATVADLLSVTAPELVSAARTGGAVVTDGRGLAVPLDLVLTAGAILRAAHSARRAGNEHAGE